MKTLGPWDGTSVPPTGMGTTPSRGVIQYPDGLEPEEPPVEAEPAEAEPVEEPPPAEEPPAEVQAENEGYDPSDYTVAEVQAYLSEHPDETDAVLDREREGKARVTLLNPKEN